MHLILQKNELKFMNSLGRKSSVMEYHSHRKLIPLMTLSSIGLIILNVNCLFFHIEPQIHAVS